MSACPDARLLLHQATLRGLLQLPAGWTAGAIRIRDDRLIEVDVVFPDGPTEHQPVHLVPHYRQEAGGIAFDHMDVLAAVPTRPWRPGRWPR